MHLTADTILTNGNILTVDADFTVAEAIAIRDGRVLATGTSDDIAGLAGPQTRRIDLAGRTVLPGLIDAHCHMLTTGLLLGNVVLHDCRSMREVLSRVAARAAVTPPGQWIIGRGWDESVLAEGRPPSREELDEIAPFHPVCLHRVWNKLMANSKAMELAGVTRDTPDPDSSQAYAGSFDRDEHGEPTGLFRDRAKDMIIRHIPPPTLDEKIAALGRVSRTFNALGLVGVADPGLYPEDLRAYHLALARGDLTIRTGLCLAGWGFGTAEWEPQIKSFVEGIGVGGGFGGDRLWFDAVKFMVDGGIGDRTAALHEPYVDSADRGQFIVAEESLPDLVRWCHDRGWPVESHTCGDRAQDAVVSAYAAAYEAAPNPALRHRIHHAYLPTPHSLALMAQHAIPAVVNPPFLHYMGESFVASLGAERAARMKPGRTYLNAGIALAGSSDSTVSDYNPFVGIWTMVARRTLADRTLGPDERLTRAEAIRLYTSGAAYAMRREATWGSLEPGKLADFAILDRNILTCPEDDIKTIRPVQTFLGGEEVYSV